MMAIFASFYIMASSSVYSDGAYLMHIFPFPWLVVPAFTLPDHHDQVQMDGFGFLREKVSTLLGQWYKVYAYLLMWNSRSFSYLG